MAARLRTEWAQTADGPKVRVAANMASPDELQAILESGAQEVGLLRTEFLYMNRSSRPDKDEQTRLYAYIVKGLAGRPLTIRTIDIGGDKPVAYLDRPAEANPNLGWRGMRYSLDQETLLNTQLRAILRASAGGPLRILFPLVSIIDQIHAARQRVSDAKSALQSAGVAFDDHVEIGIMMEVPAAAELADQLAAEVDFFSIGANDLTQYVMAADRGNDKVQSLFDPFHPAVLRMVRKSILAVQGADIWIGMRGAMVGNPMAAPILIGMGLDEFSVLPQAIPGFKLALNDPELPQCSDLARQAVTFSSSEEVRALVSETGLSRCLA